MWFFSEEQRTLQEWFASFARTHLQPQAAAVDATGSFRGDLWPLFGQHGLLGLTLSEADGGSGLGALEATVMFEEFGAVDASTALSLLAHAILCTHSLATHGSPEQKKHFLPRLLEGSWIGGLALSEPQAGSDALGIQLRGERQGTDYLLTGAKTWITNGPVGDLFYCYARTGPERTDLSAFLVEATWPGFSKAKTLSKMGMRGSPTGELHFDRVRVPADCRVGEEGKAVAGLFQNLDLERLTISGISLGLARSALAIAGQYARERLAFGKPIGAFQQIQERLAEGQASYEACRSLTYEVAKEWDLGKASGRVLSYRSAAVKLQAAQMATRVCLEAIQILGGAGYSSEFPVERFLRDAKLMEIGAGTNEILRWVIARHLLGKEVTQ